MSFTTIAATGDRFASFGPFVASVNEAGTVAFEVTLADGGSLVATGDGAELTEHPVPADLRRVSSHPDLNADGELGYYGELESGDERVFLLSGGVTSLLAGGFTAIGPAGPTMNDEGTVAFRGQRSFGVAGVYTVAAGVVTTIAEAGDTFAAFFGLPLLDPAGVVVFRADRSDGVQGIYRSDGGGVEPVVETGAGLETIMPFPSLDADGRVAFAATTDHGDDGAFIADGGIVRVDGGEGFESQRSVLLSGDIVLRIASLPGNRLGLFRGPDPSADRILAVGDPLLDSTVEALAANAVSISAAGHLAIVVSLTDGRGVIVRATLA
jgi:hypothetical protein